MNADVVSPISRPVSNVKPGTYVLRENGEIVRINGIGPLRVAAYVEPREGLTTDRRLLLLDEPVRIVRDVDAAVLHVERQRIDEELRKLEEPVRFLLDGLGVGSIGELHRLVERGRMLEHYDALVADPEVRRTMEVFLAPLRESEEKGDADSA